jgi:hypothetical protein
VGLGREKDFEERVGGGRGDGVVVVLLPTYGEGGAKRRRGAQTSRSCRWRSANFRIVRIAADLRSPKPVACPRCQLSLQRSTKSSPPLDSRPVESCKLYAWASRTPET